jgi:glyoxylase-like metal-dependent hydrolase (beta-lactamase superfamily II)
MLAIERYDDVIRLRMSTSVTRALGYEASAYFTRGMLVDTGFPAVAQDLAHWLDGTRPTGVLITHQHEDHAGNLELLVRGGLPVAASDATLAAIRAARPLGLYRRVNWGSPPALRSPVTRFDPEGLRLLPTPGHTPDHHVVWDAERETIFSGDLFLSVKMRLAQDVEDVHGVVRSLHSVIALAPKRMFCAHRGSVHEPVATLRAKAAWMEEIIGESRRLAAKGMPVGAITRQLLGRDGFTRIISVGKLSKRNLIRSALRTAGD